MPDMGPSWAGRNYSKTDGRPASSIEEGGKGGKGGTRDAQSQMEAAKGGGVNGAPGVSAMNKSGSADSGRRKWGGQDLG